VQCAVLATEIVYYHCEFLKLPLFYTMIIGWLARFARPAVCYIVHRVGMFIVDGV